MLISRDEYVREIEAENAQLRKDLESTRVALFVCAAHCQGGHSDAGALAAQELRVPFPIRMADLKKRAIAEGYDPAGLWPWYKG